MSTAGCIPPLPIELFALIISWIPTSSPTSKCDLASCSLVNSTFRDLVLPQLFGNINLKLACSDLKVLNDIGHEEKHASLVGPSRTKTLRDLCNFLENCPRIGRCISTLMLHALADPCSILSDQAQQVDPRLFLAMINSLPRLRVLRLIDVVLDVDKVYPALQEFKRCPYLKRLSVTTSRSRKFTAMGGRTFTTRMLFNLFEHIEDLFWINQVEEAYQMGLSLPEHLKVGAVHVVNRTTSTILKAYALIKSSTRIQPLLRSLDLPPTYPAQSTDGYLLLDLLKAVGDNLEYLAIGANFMNSNSRRPDEVFSHCIHLKHLVLYVPISTRLHRFLDFNTVRIWNAALSSLLYIIKSAHNLPSLQSVTLKIQSITPEEEDRRRRSRILVEKLHADGRDTHAMDCRQTLRLVDRTLRAAVLRKSVRVNLEFVEPSGMRRKVAHGRRLFSAMFPTAVTRGAVHLIL